MFKKSLCALALSSLAFGAMAQEVTVAPEFETFRSMKSRDQVKAELLEARRAGELASGEVTIAPEFAKARSLKTRAAVKAELEAYIRSGQAERDRQLYQSGG